ncbi:MAG: DUF4956 domain-containing protein [Dermabacter sp.]|nr:DUF4956 domain-containing protein [Dermabacter sp.]
MGTVLIYAINIALAATLAFGIYFPRHRRKDLVVAFMGINIGVMAVAALLASSTVTAGLGLGLFGVLSIIRLRSDELGQNEIAYYFAFLALGLIAGLSIQPYALTLAFMVLVVATMAIIDHPAMLGKNARTVMVVDRAFLDQNELSAHLADVLDADITGVTIQRIDQVADTTWVDVRYRPRGGRGSTSRTIPHEASAADRARASHSIATAPTREVALR